MAITKNQLDEWLETSINDHVAKMALIGEVERLSAKIGKIEAIANELSWDKKTRAISIRIHDALSGNRRVENGD